MLVDSEFSGRIRTVRKNAKMSQAAFATEIDVSRAAVTRYESGETIPTGTTLAHICNKFGIIGHWLLTGAAEMNQEASLQGTGAWREGPAGVTSALAANQASSDTRPRNPDRHSPLDEEGDRALEQAALLASRSRQGLVWHSLQVLVKFYPQWIAAPTLWEDLMRNGATEDLSTLDDDLHILALEGLIERRYGTPDQPPQYRMRTSSTELRAREVSDGGALLLDSMERMATCIMPAAVRRDGTGILINTVATMSRATGVELVRKLRESIRAEWDAAAIGRDGDSEVSLVIGVAINPGEQK